MTHGSSCQDFVPQYFCSSISIQSGVQPVSVVYPSILKYRKVSFTFSPSETESVQIYKIRSKQKQITFKIILPSQYLKDSYLDNLVMQSTYSEEVK